MTPPESFFEMRRSLVAQGLLGADFALTDAGQAYVSGLIEGLRRVEAEDYHGPLVSWNTGKMTR